jgi:hypothetical protein
MVVFLWVGDSSWYWGLMLSEVMRDLNTWVDQFEAEFGRGKERIH